MKVVSQLNLYEVSVLILIENWWFKNDPCLEGLMKPIEDDVYDISNADRLGYTEVSVRRFPVVLF